MVDFELKKIEMKSYRYHIQNQRVIISGWRYKDIAVEARSKSPTGEQAVYRGTIFADTERDNG